MATKRTEKRDLYAEVTSSIVEALETAGSYERPWTLAAGGASSPKNVDGRHYRGVNTVLLWAASIDAGYSSGIWGTYRAWQAAGAQVRKGEKGTTVVLWKPVEKKNAGAGESSDEKSKYLLLRHYMVFAAEQVDGYEIPVDGDPLPELERDETADGFFARIGADVRYGGNTAGYLPSLDYIAMPEPEQFVDREHFYSVLAHEHGHWTGHRSRLDRDLSGRFGDASYAAEELIAELTAAFVAARLGFHATVRDDHAAYIASWIKLLRSDDRAIFTAAAAAQRACDFLVVSGVDPADVEIAPATVGDATEELS